MSLAEPENVKPRLDYLDGLRGLAILGVVLVHSGQVANPLPALVNNVAEYGSRGVQLFFVVSAFTMMAVYSNRRIEWRDFYIRRFLRIAPMFYLALIVYALLAYRDGRPHHWGDIAATLLFVHGWVPSAFNSVVPGGWSIACEAMFYLCLPFLMAVIRGPVTALAAVGVTTVSGFCIVLFGPEAVQAWAGDASVGFVYFSFPAQASAFLGGIAAYHGLMAIRDSKYQALGRAASPWVLAFLSIIVIVIALSGLRGLNNYLVASGLFSVALVAIGLSGPGWLGTGALAWLGRLSFSIYLTHFVFLEPAEALSTSMTSDAGARLALAFGFLLSASVAISCVTHRWIELPMIALGQRLTSGMKPLSQSSPVRCPTIP